MNLSRIAHRRTAASLAAPLFAACLLASAAVPALAQSTTTSLRSYFDTLGNSYPTQLQGSTWTFRNGSASGALFAAGPVSYLGFGLHQQVGLLVNTGTLGCTPGFCNVPLTQTLATFDGVFVHPGASAATAVVWRADAPTLALWLAGLGALCGVVWRRRS